MKVSNVIKQLEDIIDYSRSCIDDNTVWNDDIEALKVAIKIIKSKEEVKKEEKKKYFWMGSGITSVVMLILHFLWIIKGGC